MNNIYEVFPNLFMNLDSHAATLFINSYSYYDILQSLNILYKDNKSFFNPDNIITDIYKTTHNIDILTHDLFMAMESHTYSENLWKTHLYSPILNLLYLPFSQYVIQPKDFHVIQALFDVLSINQPSYKKQFITYLSASNITKEFILYFPNYIDFSLIQNKTLLDDPQIITTYILHNV